MTTSRTANHPATRSRRLTPLIALLSAAAIGLTGCLPLVSAFGPDPNATPSPDASSGTGDVESSDPVDPWEDAAAQLSETIEPTWIADDVRPIGSAALYSVDDTVLAYVQLPDKPIALAAFDVETGEQLWIQDASINSVNTMGELQPVFIADGDDAPLVALLAPPHEDTRDAWAASLMLLDIRTGQPVAGFDTMWIWSYWECGLERTVCFWGSPPTSQDAELFTFSAEDGVVPYTDVFGDYETTRTIWSDLWAVTDDGGAQSLVHLDEGDIEWSIPAGDLVGDGELVDALISAQLLEDGEILVLHVHPETAIVPYTASAQGYLAIGIDADSGEVLWSLDGYLPCSLDLAHPVLCSGDIVHRHEDPELPVETEAGAVDVHGFDARTGELLWTESFAELTSYSSTSDRAVVGFGDYWVGQEGDEVRLVDRETGRVRVMAEDERVGCLTSIIAQVPEFTIPSYDPVTIEMGTAVSACSATDMVPGVSGFTRAVVLGTGSHAWTPDAWISPAESRHVVVQTHDGLYGFDLGA